MKRISIVISLLAAILTAPMTPVSGQSTTACTSSLISSFTPCLNYLLGSTNGGGSPTAECCKSLASLVTSSTDCACLILTGNVPLLLPINRNLAISLPRLCRSTSVPLQCSGTAMPLPSPGPYAFSPSLPPLPPTQSEPLPPLPTPTSPLEPTSLSPSSPLEPASPPPVIGDADQGQRPLVLPSSAMKPSHIFSASILPLLVIGIMLFDKF
ncbi:non-specific lipid transfer protein GPI-anchored 16 [Elaeis guineensis]|uniref:Non-specific lipid transfer protein GPI-anchored 2 n=1 Tax=Elaeis guineensis var. tenera TaxID=51953 RepID=A0A1D5AIW4_ELAGV|nr:non-specific lipid transfer protein GPI-anchored 2 [Elaeis guineensis]AOC88991.1 type 7 nonspecific lipid transfer protein LTP702 [Elaeis guineensis]